MYKYRVKFVETFVSEVEVMASDDETAKLIGYAQWYEDRPEPKMQMRVHATPIHDVVNLTPQEEEEFGARGC